MTGVLTTPAKVGVVNLRSSPRVGRRRENIKSNAVTRFFREYDEAFFKINPLLNLIFSSKKRKRKNKKRSC